MPERIVYHMCIDQFFQLIDKIHVLIAFTEISCVVACLHIFASLIDWIKSSFFACLIRTFVGVPVETDCQCHTDFTVLVKSNLAIIISCLKRCQECTNEIWPPIKTFFSVNWVNQQNGT